VGLILQLLVLMKRRKHTEHDVVSILERFVCQQSIAENILPIRQRHRHLPSHSVLASIVDDVRRFSAPDQFDDTTLTVAACRR
jgi:hypothetical protein